MNRGLDFAGTPIGTQRAETHHPGTQYWLRGNASLETIRGLDSVLKGFALPFLVVRGGLRALLGRSAHHELCKHA